MTPYEVRRSWLFTAIEFFLLAFLLCFLFVSPWFYGLTRFKDQLIAEISIFSLFLTSLPFLEKQSILRVKRGGLDFWIVLSLLLGLVYTFLSATPYQSFLAFLRLSGLGLFYALVRAVVTTERRFQLICWAIMAAGLFYSVYGLAQYYGLLPHPFWYLPDSLASRFVNGGHFSAWLLFPVFVGIALVFSGRNPVIWILITVFLLVMGWALLLSRSRAVWGALFIGTLIFISGLRRFRLLSKGAGFGIAGLALGGALLLWTRGGVGDILERAQELWDTRFYSLIYRWELWQASLAAWAARPWGWGLGTFSSILPQYRTHSDRFFVDYAHNEFLQLGVDLGVIGIFLLTGFLISYFRNIFSLLRSQQVEPIQKVRAAAFLALGVGWILVSQFDFPLRIYATSFSFATFLALSAYLFDIRNRQGEVLHARRAPSQAAGVRFSQLVVVFVSVLVLGALAGKQLAAQNYFERGRLLEKDFAWDEATMKYQKAIKLSPLYAEYHEGLGFLARRRAVVSLSREQKKDFRRQAIQAYQEAARLEPTKALNHYSLALLNEADGDLKRAQSEFLKAILYDPTNAYYVSEYGNFSIRHAWTQEAIAAFEKFKQFSFKGATKESLMDILNQCYVLTEDYDQLRRVVPNDPEGHFVFGHVLGDKGRWELAQKEFDVAIELEALRNPSGSLAQIIADFYIQHTRFPDALKVYEKIMARDPGNAAVQKKLSDVSERIKISQAVFPS